MKQATFTFLLLSAIGLISCRKSGSEPDIKQYDQIQIQNYISANGLTDMLRDKTGGDTTGMYYKIITRGDSIDATGQPIAPLNYPDKISMVFSLRSLDGKYVSSDTINNHFDDYLGHISASKLPLGLQTGIHNLLRFKGGSMRLLIPSHLAYGVNGYGTGSTQNANTRIGGNQSLDYYVRVIGTIKGKDDEAAYDDQVITSYMTANGLSGYTKTATGLYYKILTPGTSSTPITTTSVCTATYTGQLLNKFIFDSTYNGTTVLTFTLSNFATPGNVEGLQNYAHAGTKISLIMPSALGYGRAVQGSIPANSCLRFTWQIVSVTN